MPYQAEISRRNPTCFLCLLDQSGSMQSVLDPTNMTALDLPKVIDGILYTHEAEGKTASQELSEKINDFLYSLANNCAQEEGIRDYFYVGVIGYNHSVAPAFIGDLAGKKLVPISELAEKTYHIEERTTDEGEIYKYPIWFLPVAEGDQTRMCEALQLAHSIIENWLQEHPNCYPPIVINITDGRATDGDPTIPAQSLKDLSSSDGNVLLFNCHLAKKKGNEILFPDTKRNLPDDLARTLFEMSSQFPAEMRNYAEILKYNLSENSRGFVYNAKVDTVIDLLDIGTQTENSCLPR
ncbi:VWA domain-containing protein [Aetokthonos hydrillicola Thurmond2011]|jgi:hypothetical protein|uniref:VWA domain-containing protein n=1 Tax=Aetokthonos hydrillicola Thurmond2011 TaxID=2712845 RepID=A0AAP5MED3_9CYAN|nr:hypothetical protein [Aetokthonos hydrillicola]MBO3461860.1 VWA domain-containing protein [Aetokthonos hydrillicola CCALA 1050]MBW4588892.1 VWA domain-containing protein [Aetokthonos hydrillicola CCALA 1050]MDR9900918.1 VWA domain-containing protein [Aetokthonos hydrillicola Thurmond2011]